MKTALIFGSGGQLGFDLKRLLEKDYNCLPLERRDVNITKSEEVSEAICKAQPDFVVNAAGYNKVVAAESEKEEAFAVNEAAVGSMAKAAAAAGAIFVHVSTDYVFDGSQDFFTEDDAPHPLNAYGASKLAGEALLKKLNEKFYIIRTSSVFGIKQSNQKMNFVDKIISQAREGQALKIVGDQVMSPTYSLDLAIKIKELMEKPASFGLYHITNQGSCSWYEFAKKILQLMKLNASLEPVTAEQTSGEVERPKKSVLKNLRLEKEGFAAMPSWKNALGRYLIEKYGV